MKDWTLWLFEMGSVLNLVLLFALMLSTRQDNNQPMRRWILGGAMGVILIVTLVAGFTVFLRP